MELRYADEQWDYWCSQMVREFLGGPQLLSIVRLCGEREMVAFALGALIGDIKRFAEPRKFVNTSASIQSLITAAKANVPAASPTMGAKICAGC
ncbi:MAG: hypothetical protein WCH99_06225 [Verrucomicrobiota bacterium]